MHYLVAVDQEFGHSFPARVLCSRSLQFIMQVLAGAVVSGEAELGKDSFLNTFGLLAELVPLWL